MLKKLSFLIGLPFTGILLLILIISMALATFVESSQGTNAAWSLIYGAHWFELIFLLVLVNLIGNIFISKLYRRKKITVFIFHASFIVIILGAGITRFLSSEGIMHIREGAVSASIISDDTYMDVNISSGGETVSSSKKVRLSVLTPKKYRWKGTVDGKKVKIRSVGYLKDASAQYVAMPGGEPYVQLVVLAGRQFTVGLTSGQQREYPGISFSLDQQDSKADLRIISENDTLMAISKFPVSLMVMGGGEGEEFEPGVPFPFEQAKLYSVNGVRLALQRYMQSAKLQYVKGGESGMSSGMNVAKLEIEVDGMKSQLFVPGMANVVGQPAFSQMGPVSIECTYGSRNIVLPFVLRLEDFRIDRYPGSNSPSSFESDVVLIDTEHDINELHNIYMNNVLKHRGYRFYQSSYDQDEKGTILSVNRDLAGTSVTYTGYFLLALGMILSLIARGTRFASIARSTSSKTMKTTAILLALLFSGAWVSAQTYPAPSKEDATEFGKIWVQGKEGRFKPMNTLSNEVMRKVVKEARYDGYNADQVMLGMIIFPDEWKQAPIFEVENPEIHQLLGYKGEHVCFNDFVSDGNYLLSNLVNEAYNKRVQDRTDLDKEVMKLDEKINVFYMVQSGALLKIFPDPDAEDGKWHAVSELLPDNHMVSDTLGQVFLLYTSALREGDSQMAGEIVRFIGNYQEKNSNHELHQGKKNAEIFYNKVNLFYRLFKFYGLLGFTLLFLQFMRIFKPANWVESLFRIILSILTIGIILHTVFLALRWYVSGHAPLSNGYESMIFVSWITLLAGLIFARKTGFAIALTAILATLSLLVAHMSWMNPDITNLVPVLKSPWLTIHVTVIMSGYGFTGLSMLMGLINLVLISILNTSNTERISKVISQVTKVNQLSVIIGVYFLTVGTFLGGVWANESWGRYWGWDPKETWALISVLVYSFITHMHHFPGMKGSYAFNLASLIGYFSILMTYFGVNYFLGGIHSYAGGISFTLPIYVYITVLALIGIAIIAYRKRTLILPDN